MGIVTNPDCVIFAAGNAVPFGIVQPYLKSNPFLIAADGGFALAKQLGLTPNLVIGDFDSSKRPDTTVEIIALNPIKDATDSACALEEAVRRGYKNIVLFGGTGLDRLDHTFANFDLCAYAKTKGTDLMLADAHHRIFILQNETAEITDAQNQYVSVFAFGGACTVSEEGFFYPLSHYTFAPFCGLGVSNEVTADMARITAEQGTALVFITDKDV